MKYSIEDLRNGKVAVINDGTIEELREVLRLAFPDDHDVPHGDGRIYRAISRVLPSKRWTSTDNEGIPSQSVKLFLLPIKYSIKDLAEGNVMVINDGTDEELMRLLKLAFPNDNYIPLCNADYYRSYPDTKGKYIAVYKNNTTDLLITSKQSVKDFLPKEEVKQQPIIAIQGYEIDEASSTDSKIVYRKIRVTVASEPAKPEIKSWEDLEKIDGYYISDESEIMKQHGTTESDIDKNVFPSESEAEAMLAMAQLCQLRDRVNDGWKPDWRDSEDKYCIVAISNKLNKNTLQITNTAMAFRRPAVRDMFMVDFKELLTIAIPFL